MNVQLLFQMLIHEATQEGVNVEAAETLTLSVQSETLKIFTEGKKFNVKLMTAEERRVMYKKYPISGPAAIDITIHMSEMQTSGRRALTFNAPTFGECTPDFEKFDGERIDVMFDTATAIHGHSVRFEGVAFISTDGQGSSVFPCGTPCAGMQVYGIYDKTTETGWMSPNRFSSIESYVC